MATATGSVVCSASDTPPPPSQEGTAENAAQSAVTVASTKEASICDIPAQFPVELEPAPSYSSAAKESTAPASTETSGPTGPHKRSDGDGDNGPKETNVPTNEAITPSEDRPQNSLQTSQDLLQKMGLDIYATGVLTLSMTTRARGKATVQAAPNVGSEPEGQAGEQEGNVSKSKR